MKLYIHPFSSNARRARMAAKLLGLAPEEVIVDLTKGEQKRPEYLALNPHGKVPTLVDGDTVIWESIAIMTYLAERTPGQTIYPTDARGKTNQTKWLFWAANHWGPAIGQLTFENFLKGLFNQGPPNEYAVQRGEAMFKEFATTLDKTLASSRNITSDQITVVDLAIAAPLMYVGPAKLPATGFANIERWFGEIKALDAWTATQPPNFPA
jgi:glutathione S-transferase